MRSPSRSAARTCCTTGSAASTRPARTLAARAAEAQRFERESAAIAETFVDEGDAVRRLLLVGLGGAARTTTALTSGSAAR